MVGFYKVYRTSFTIFHDIFEPPCEIWGPMLTSEPSPHSIGITGTRHKAGQGGQTVRNANLCKMVKFTEESAIKCTVSHNGFNLLQRKIWVPIVVLICYIFMNTIIVNTAHILIHYCSGWLHRMWERMSLIPSLPLAKGKKCSFTIGYFVQYHYMSRVWLSTHSPKECLSIASNNYLLTKQANKDENEQDIWLFF